ncbi:MAG: S1 family peptidase [Solirubrobacteraceae bacterium]
MRLVALAAAAIAGATIGPAATGFVAAPGRVVTVAHAVPGATAAARGGDGIVRRGSVVWRDESLDLAVVALPGLGKLEHRDGALDPRPSGLARSSAATTVLVRRHGAVTALSATLVRRAAARVRSGDGGLLARRPVLELRASIRAGDSGAPVLDAGGRVVGVVFARSRARPGTAYAVDAAGSERLPPWRAGRQTAGSG